MLRSGLRLLPVPHSDGVCPGPLPNFSTCVLACASGGAGARERHDGIGRRGPCACPLQKLLSRMSTDAQALVRACACECVCGCNHQACDADANCTWCKCAAVPSKCYNLTEAKILPPSVFACDKTAAVHEATQDAVAEEAI